jgi:ribosome-interacting GTPase 1
MELEMSALPKTWVLDLDGTIVKHNGYKVDGKDTLLDGAREFLSQIRSDDMVIFVTSRKKEYKDITENFLIENNIRFDYIIYEAPYGERILVNDRKPSGLQMAYAINTERDKAPITRILPNELL